MAIIEVDEPFASAPKVKFSRRWSAFDPSMLAPDRGLVELSGVRLEPHTLTLTDSADDPVDDFQIDDCQLVGVDLSEVDRVAIDLVRSAIDDCDLSRTTIRSIRGSKVTGSKLVGTELSGASITDVVFERCTLRYTNFRMSTLRRVRFEDCVLDDVDAFEASMEDVEFAGCEVTGLDVDRISAARVDLRTSSPLELKGIGSLAGLLVSQHQLPELALSLATAVGLDVEAMAEQ